jgi:hypothetical protein
MTATLPASPAGGSAAGGTWDRTNAVADGAVRSSSTSKAGRRLTRNASGLVARAGFFAPPSFFQNQLPSVIGKLL